MHFDLKKTYLGLKTQLYQFYPKKFWKSAMLAGQAKVKTQSSQEPVLSATTTTTTAATATPKKEVDRNDWRVKMRSLIKIGLPSNSSSLLHRFDICTFWWSAHDDKYLQIKQLFDIQDRVLRNYDLIESFH